MSDPIEQLVDDALAAGLRRRGLDADNVPPAAEQALTWLAQAVDALAPALQGDPDTLSALAAGFEAWVVGFDAEASRSAQERLG